MPAFSARSTNEALTFGGTSSGIIVITRSIHCCPSVCVTDVGMPLQICGSCPKIITCIQAFTEIAIIS